MLVQEGVHTKAAGHHQLPTLMAGSERALYLFTGPCTPAYSWLKSTLLQGLDVEFRSLMGELAALQPSNGHARGPTAGAAEVLILVTGRQAALQRPTPSPRHSQHSQCA